MPVCGLKRVARKVNVYFSYIHSIAVNVSNFNCNQFFNLPVIIELKGTDSHASYITTSICSVQHK